MKKESSKFKSYKKSSFVQNDKEHLNPRVENIPRIHYNANTRQSNIMDVKRVLSSYVKKNFKTLHNCIDSRRLLIIQEPPIPLQAIVPIIPVAPVIPVANAAAPVIPVAPNAGVPIIIGAQSDNGTTVNDEMYDSDDEEHGDDEELTDDLNIPYDIRVRRYEVLFEIYCNRKKLQTDELSNLFYVIDGIIPIESRETIRSHSDYNKACRKLDGVLLWNIVYTTLQFSSSVFTHSDQKGEASRNFWNLRQHPNQSLNKYFTLFKDRLKILKEVNGDVPDEAMLSNHFYTTLDKDKFSELIKVVNQARYTGIQIPTKLGDAFAFAAEFLIDERSYKSDSNNNSNNNTNVYNYESKKIFNNNKKIKNSNNNPQPIPVNNPQPKQKSSTGTLYCSYCFRNNHIIDDCWCKKKHMKNPPQSSTTTTSENSLMETTLENILPQEQEATVLTNQSSDEDITSTSLILDTGAQSCIFNNEELLHGVTTSNNNLRIYGINKQNKPVVTNRYGYLEGLKDIPIYISTQVKRNILSFSQVGMKYDINFNKHYNEFIINADNNVVYKFKLVNKLYINNYFNKNDVNLLTTEGNTSNFSKAEIVRAEQARIIQQRLSFESDQSIIQAIKLGSINNLPITTQDVVNAHKIFGPSIPSLKGKSTSKKSKSYAEILIDKGENKQIKLIIDLMYVNGDTYFISLSDSIDLTIIKFLSTGDTITTKSKEDIGKALTEHVMLYKSEGFYINTVISDNEAVMKSITIIINSLGARHETGGVKSNSLAKLDRKIRLVKDRTRALLYSIPYTWPNSIMKWPIEFAVRSINLIKHSHNPTDNRSPMEMFTGKKTDYNRDLRISFGQYVQILPSSTNNTLKERTSGGICLRPTSNKNGSVYFLSISSGRNVLADRWVEIPIPQSVIDYMNQQAELCKTKYTSKDPTFIHRGKLVKTIIDEDVINIQPSKFNDYQAVMNIPPPSHLAGSEINGRKVRKSNNFIDANDLQDEDDEINPQEEIQNENENPLLSSSLPNLQNECIVDNENEFENEIENEYLNQLNENRNEFDNDQSQENVFDESINGINLSSPTSQGVRTSNRKRIPNQQLNDYLYYISVEDEGGSKQEIDNAIKEELRQMELKNVFQPVLGNEITKIPIPSRMFVKKKVDSSGNLIKWKARLVAGGHKQIRDEDLNTSSPTANRTSIMMIAGIAAQQHRVVATADVKGAFLNANMSSDVFMTLNKELAQLMIEINPNYIHYKNEKGCIVVKLIKALYGCIESAKLWYDEISTFIQSIGFIKSVNDQCVFIKKEIDNSMTHLTIYVDDLLITSPNKQYIENIERELIQKYNEISFNFGQKQEYLGMEFNFEKHDEVTISMRKKIENLLVEYDINKISNNSSNK